MLELTKLFKYLVYIYNITKMTTIFYHCGLCNTYPDAQKSHHTKHKLTNKHLDKKRIKELEITNLSKEDRIRLYHIDDIGKIIDNIENVKSELIKGYDNPIICNNLLQTTKYKPSNNILWKLEDNPEENKDNNENTNQLKSIIKTCHDKLYSSNSIVGVKAQNDIMKILCIKLLQDQFNDESSEIYQRCENYKTELTEKQYEKYMSYCKDIKNLINTTEDVFKEWKFLVNQFLISVLPSIYFEQDSKFNCENANCIIDLFKIINKLEINNNFKDSFSTACGDIHEAFRAYGGGKGAKELGQYFTPRHLIHLMFHATGINTLLKQDEIYDPCMGTGGFLTRLFKLANIESKHIYGCETELDTIKFGYMSLYLTTNDCKHNIQKCNSLTENDFMQNIKVGSIITNPPFGTKMNYKDLEKKYNQKYPNSNIKFTDIYPRQVNNGACLFIQHCVFMLKENGFCAIVLPDGEIFEGNSKWSKTFRKWWCNKVNIRTILKVASGTFEHAGVKTNVVIFTNDGPTEDIKFMETSKECNEVKELFTITKNDLQSTDYSLDIGEYLEETNENYNCPMIDLGDKITFLPKSKKKASDGQISGKYPFYTSSQKCTKYCDKYDYEEQCLIIGTGGTANIKYNKRFSCSADNLIIKLSDSINNDYVYYYLQFNMNLLENGFKGQCIKHISIDYVKKLKIPLPSPEIQQEIVDELTIVEDSIKTIETRLKQLKLEKEQYKKYARKSEIRGLLGDCDRVPLSNICEIDNNIPKHPTSVGSEEVKKYRFYTGGKTKQLYCDECDIKFEAIIQNRTNGSGKCNLFIDKNFSVASQTIVYYSKNKNISTKYIYLYFKYNIDKLERGYIGANHKNMSKEFMMKVKIPILSPEIQQQCITIFEQKEQYLNKIDEKINKEKEYMDELKSLGKDIINSVCNQ